MFPRLFELGSFSLPTYGVLIALGFLVGISLSARLARRSGLDPERITNLGIVLLVSAILGAKLFLIADNWTYYSADLSRLFSLEALRSGGVFYGGLVTAIGVAFYYTRRNRMPWLATADAMVPGLAFGHAIGRLGCYAAGCCWGREAHLAWAVTFTDPAAHSFTGVPLNVPLHPTQLYEASGTALIGVVLLWLYLRPHAAGTILGAYLGAVFDLPLLRGVFPRRRCPHAPGRRDGQHHPSGGGRSGFARWLPVARRAPTEVSPESESPALRGESNQASVSRAFGDACS